VSEVVLRPRSAPELIDAAIQLYRRHFVPLLMLSAILNIPLFAVSAVIAELSLSLRPTAPDLGASFALIGLAALELIWYSVLECAVIVAAAERYLGHTIEPMAALRQVLRRLGPILGSVILKGFVLVMVLGSAMLLFTVISLSLGLLGTLLLLLMFPAVLALALYLAARLFAIPGVVVLEPLGPFAALRRSAWLSEGRVLKTIGALLLVWLVFLVAFISVTLVGQLFGAFSRVLATAIANLASCVVYPLVAIVSMLLYYDARIMKEGFDIELMSREIDGSQVGAVSP
jgi:hypothetical protein